MHEFLRQELVIDLLHLNELPLEIVAHLEVSVLIGGYELQSDETLHYSHDNRSQQSDDQSTFERRHQ